MNILFTRFPLESSHGGAEVQTMALAQGLRRHGHAVSFLGSCPTLLRLFREAGMPAEELLIGPPPVSAGLALSFLWRKRAMRQRLEAALASLDHLDAVCMLSLSEKLLLTPACADRGERTLWIEHDRVGRWLDRNPWLRMLKRNARHATIVTVSHLSKRIYEWMGFDPDGIIAIPNGIETARLRAVGAEDRGKGQESAHELRLGCIARLSPEKGVDVLLRALALLPDVTLEIVGEGPEEASLRALADELKIADRVTFSAPQRDVGAVYARMDALALPSRDHDPFGLAAGEAMMLGLPVIVTNACGIADYLGDDEDALIVPAGSADALAAAIRALQDAGTRARIGEHAARTADREFSVDAMVEAYEEALR